MKSRRTKIGLLLTVVVLALGGFFRWATYEPSYLGKSLSAWIASYGSNREHNLEVDAAIRGMGDEALPHLLEILQRKDSDFSQRVAELFRQQTIIETRFLPGGTWRTHAATGIRALGDLEEESEVVVPVLTRLVEDPETASSALEAAANLGWRSLPLIRTGLAYTNDTIRSVAAVRLGGLAQKADARSHADDLVPLLLKNLKDPAPMIRRFAASGLVATADRETAIAALLSNIQDPDRRVRFFAAWQFQAFGVTADSAIPKLKELRKDPVVGRDAERALSFIRVELQDVNKPYFRSGTVVPPYNPYK